GVRVTRLLRDGIEPAKILCITFTKAAAANMANRVFSTLRAWTELNDGALDDAIRRESGLKPDAARRALARRLFAVALDTPGGLKVQTIHAFCTRLLHQFPFEANVAARFTVLDETAEAKLLGEVGLEVLLAAAQAPEGQLGRALATATAEVADQTFKEVVAEAIRERDMVRAWIGHGGSIEAAIAGLCGDLGVAEDDTIERIEGEISESPLLPAARWPALVRTLAQGSKNDREQAGRLEAALAAIGPERVHIYSQIFFTDENKPRRRLITKAIEADEPELWELPGAGRARLLALMDRGKAVACRDRTAALLVIADAVISRYQAAKDRRGLLDYDDLIDKTVALLGAERAAWVHYKLDQ